MARIVGPRRARRSRRLGADDAGRIAPALAVDDGAADHHVAAHDLRRRGDVVDAETDRADAVHQRDAAGQAEVLTRLAGQGVERDEVQRLAGGEDALGAGACRAGTFR